MLTCHHSLWFSLLHFLPFPLLYNPWVERKGTSTPHPKQRGGFTKGQNKGLLRSVIRKASRFNNRRVYSPGKAKLMSRSRLISILKTELGELVGEKVKIF